MHAYAYANSQLGPTRDLTRPAQIEARGRQAFIERTDTDTEKMTQAKRRKTMKDSIIEEQIKAMKGTPFCKNSAFDVCSQRQGVTADQMRCCFNALRPSEYHCVMAHERDSWCSVCTKTTSDSNQKKTPWGTECNNPGCHAPASETEAPCAGVCLPQFTDVIDSMRGMDAFKQVFQDDFPLCRNAGTGALTFYQYLDTPGMTYDEVFEDAFWLTTAPTCRAMTAKEKHACQGHQHVEFNQRRRNAAFTQVKMTFCHTCGEQEGLHDDDVDSDQEYACCDQPRFFAVKYYCKCCSAAMPTRFNQCRSCNLPKPYFASHERYPNAQECSYITFCTC